MINSVVAGVEGNTVQARDVHDGISFGSLAGLALTRDSHRSARIPADEAPA